jgi:4-amino-4-deoxy-L-arabinose transferase-like glycosyltransferase
MVATLWLAWLALALGVPGAVSFFGQRVPGFSMPIEASTVAIAGAGTFLWWIAVKQRPISARNAVCTWTAGLSTSWLVLLTLWLPYLDYGNAYRTVAASLAAALPRDGACVASVGLGESQRAMFDYYAGLITRRLESGADSRGCAWLLVQGTPHRPPAAAGRRWHEVWEGARPGDEAERFHLYRAEATD